MVTSSVSVVWTSILARIFAIFLDIIFSMCTLLITFCGHLHVICHLQEASSPSLFTPHLSFCWKSPTICCHGHSWVWCTLQPNYLLLNILCCLSIHTMGYIIAVQIYVYVLDFASGQMPSTTDSPIMEIYLWPLRYFFEMAIQFIVKYWNWSSLTWRRVLKTWQKLAFRQRFVVLM